MRHHSLYLLILALLALPGCRAGDPATAVDGSEGPLVIYPDYKDVTIPANIAPLNFRYAMKDVRKASGATKWNGASAPGRNSSKGLRDRRLS